MRHIVISVLVLLACIIFSACHRDASKRNEGKVLAKIDGNTITEDMFKKSMGRRRGDFTTVEKKNQLLDEMVEFELHYAAAVRQGLDKDPDMMETFRKMVVNRLIRLKLEPLLADSAVAEEEISTYYTNHIEEFHTPAMYRAAVIKFSLPNAVSDEKKELLLHSAEKARIEAASLPAELSTFGSVAVKYSNDQASRYRGGDTGWINSEAQRHKWERVVIDTIFALNEPGEISQVVQGEEGLYLVKLMEVRESMPQPLGKIQEKIRYQLIREKRKLVEKSFFAELGKDIEVSVDYLAAEAVEPPVRLQNANRTPGMPGS